VAGAKKSEMPRVGPVRITDFFADTIMRKMEREASITPKGFGPFSIGTSRGRPEETRKSSGD